MKIDVHAHFADREYLDGLAKIMGLTTHHGDEAQVLLRKGGTTVAWYRDSFFDQAERIRTMDVQGVDVRIISVSSPSIYEWPVAEQPAVARGLNERVARYCAERPDRFRGLAVLPLSDPDASIAELKYAWDELGLIGVAIGTHVSGKPLNHIDLEPVWAFIDAHRIPVVQHPMQPLGADHLDEFELPIRVGFVYETTTALTRMIYAGIFERYPNFPFVVPHTGGSLLMLLERLDNGYRLFPDCRKHISRLPSEYARQLYYDTCSFYAPALMLAHQTMGPQRLLWGSDDPYIGADTAHVDNLPISHADKQLILGGNAARLFGI